jgi:hypothetical protein
MAGLRAPRAAHTSTPEELSAFADAEATGLPLLVWRDADGRQRILTLDPSCRCTLGRRPTMAVALPWDAKVSKLHAELECIDGEWVITDDGLSRNGTYLNEVRIHERSRLRHADQIRVGHTILEFRVGEEDSELLDTDPEDGEAQLPDLTTQQRKALVALCRPWFEHKELIPAPNRQIAAELFISDATVRKTLRGCYAKCGFPDDFDGRRATVFHHAIDRGIVAPSDYR